MTERIEMRGPSLALRLGSAAEPAFEAAAQRARDERWVERLFDRDPSLWSADPRVQAAISERLGWLDAPNHFTEQIPTLEAFGDAIRDAGFTAAIVAGMGGSSLAPDVIHRTFGTVPDWLELRVLDSTDPEAVAATVDDLPPLSTLFIVATKSGTTTEPLAFQADAWARIDKALDAAGEGGTPGRFMVAITDPGKSVASIPHHDELRELFLNPPDIGGRYSALTYVGLVPASLIGLDLDPFLASATTMLAHSSAEDHLENPALALGLAIGTLAVAGRDKLTFIPDPEVGSFGMWAEQLIAESTGKQGRGIVPVDQEPLGGVASYGRDRAFVRIRVDGSAGAKAADGRPADARLDELAAAGHPVIEIDLPDPMDLAGEFVRWEVATAIAGIILGIDPFDQPNVEEAKENTRRLLARHGGSSEAAHPAVGPPPGPGGRGRGRRAHRRSGRADAVRRHCPPPELGRRHSERRAATAAREAQAGGLHLPPGLPRPDSCAGPGAGPDPDAAARFDHAARPPRATARGSSTPRASSTRAVRRAAGSCS